MIMKKIQQITEFIFRKNNKNEHKNANERKNSETNKNNKINNNKTATLNNPYVLGAAGKQEWNDRYMNMAKATRNWQIASICLVILVFIQLIIIGKIATESKIKPYVVETNHGVPYSIKDVTTLSGKDSLLVNYAINQFVINAKTIISDTIAEKILLDKLYAFSSGSTHNFLQDFYAKHNPFELAGNYTVGVNIINSLPISKNTWQVIWEENKRQTNNGVFMETTRWVGQFTYEFGEVSAKHINDNPFGIYITSVTWSQSR